MKKEIFLLIGLVAIFSLVPVLSARAYTLTDVTVTPSNVYGGYTANHTVSFVVASSTELDAQIRLIFPAEFNVAGADAATSTDASSTGAGILASSTVSGQEVTLWLADGDVTPAGETIEVQADAIVSPYAGGSFILGVETRTLADEISADASSTPFSIFGGNQEPSLYSDRIAPTSNITSPTDGLTISTGEEYVIQGTAQDEGGSTVQKVEVSLDGGQNWSVTEIKSALANVFSWEYIWQNPTEGEYTIRARATDAVGNIESPLAGVKVTVSVSVPPTVAPEEKPITEMTVQELEAKIVEVQQKIVDLLQQLIQLLQGEIQKLLAK